MLRSYLTQISKIFDLVSEGSANWNSATAGTITALTSPPAVGEEIEVLLESRENENGLCVLSKEKADRLKVWDEISAACERDELIDGTIAQRVKGGLSVTIRGGVKAFLPGSQVDLRPIRNLDKLIGQTYSFKFIKFHEKRGNIVLSRRALLERERDDLAERLKQTEKRAKDRVVTAKEPSAKELASLRARLAERGNDDRA